MDMTQPEERPKKTVSRKRPKEWKTRVTEEEYRKLKKEVKQLGMTCQEYGEQALFHRTMLTREDRVVLDEMLEETKEIKLQLRRIGNNINQLARTANVTGNVEAMQELERLQEDLDYYGREADDVWQSLKRLQNRRRPKGD